MSGAPALDALGLGFTYADGTVALDGIDLRVAAGEVLAILASNGSGKTTLLKALIGLLKPYRGTVRLFGRDLATLAPSDLYRRVGIVLQNPNDQLFGATVAEDVAFGPRNLGLPEAEVAARVEAALRTVGAAHLAARAIHQLSFGEQKRIAIAGVLAMAPSVLLLDEPTAGLDPIGEEQMMTLLGRLNREQGITIVLATHSVDLLPLLAHRICILRRGRALHEGPLGQVLRDVERLEQAELRLPYVARLFYELQRFEGIAVPELPLDVTEARALLGALLRGPK